MSSDGFVPMQDRVFTDTQETAEKQSVSMSTISVDSEPRIPPDSAGSSVSSRLQEEYEELLKYAVIVPSYPHLSSLSLNRTTASGYQAPMSHPLQAQGAGDLGPVPPATVGSHASPQLTRLPAGGQSVGPTVGVGPVHQRASPASVDVIDTSQPSDHDTTVDHEDEPVASRKRAPVSADLFVGGDQRRPTGSQLQHTGQLPQSTWAPRVTEQVLLDEDNDDDDSEAVGGSTYSYTATIDQDVSRMENLLDQWTSELKHNIMGEFSQSKIRLIEHHRQQMLLERQRHAGEGTRMQNDMDALRELLATYEQSIQRKDQVISNLTTGLQHHRNRMEMQRSFTEWKIKHNDARREAFASNLARRHYQRTLQQKVWAAWHSVIEARWRQRVEKACQAKAQEVCMALTNDYETKLSSLNEALEAARFEVHRLHEERDRYEETMKKAFMRGVCALNLEAMTMFHEPAETRGVPGQGGTEDSHGRDGETGYHDMVDDNDEFHGYHPVTVQQEYVYSTEPTGAPAPRVVNATVRAASVQPTSAQSRPSDAQKSRPYGRGAKVISAKVTARPDAKRSVSVPISGQTLVPPMTSVVVERHQPVTKQTIGHATAAKYPQSNAIAPAVVQRKIAGQQTGFPSMNVQTVKVVE